MSFNLDSPLSPKKKDAASDVHKNFALNKNTFSSLKDDAGTEEALDRAKLIVACVFVMGCSMLFTLVAKPIYTKKFAPRAAAEARAAAEKASAKMEGSSDRLTRIVERISYIQASHISRHPLRHGIFPKEPEKILSREEIAEMEWEKKYGKIFEAKKNPIEKIE